MYEYHFHLRQLPCRRREYSDENTLKNTLKLSEQNYCCTCLTNNKTTSTLEKPCLCTPSILVHHQQLVRHLLAKSIENCQRHQWLTNQSHAYMTCSALCASPPLNTLILFHQLHWLPVEFIIRFKLACLTYKPLTTITPI